MQGSKPFPPPSRKGLKGGRYNKPNPRGGGEKWGGLSCRVYGTGLGYKGKETFAKCRLKWDRGREGEKQKSVRYVTFGQWSEASRLKRTKAHAIVKTGEES